MNTMNYQNYHETKRHTDAEFPYNTYLCSIPLDFIQVPIHWHEEMELIVIQKGTGLVSVNFQTETVTSGDIAVILPGQLHSIEQREGESMEYENILFHPSMLVFGQQDLCNLQYIQPMTAGQLALERFLTPALDWYPQAARCIREIDRLCSTRPEGYQLGVKGLLFQFLFYLITNKKNRASVSKSTTKSLLKMKTIFKYVEEHYQEPVCIDDMAALTYYSKSHFMKFFKQHMGISFTEYLNDYRLTIAARLLLSSDDPILDIAVQTGFDSLSYFNRLFKRKFKMTPSCYRGSRL